MKMKEIKIKVAQFKLYKQDAVKDLKAAQKLKVTIDNALAEMPESERALYAEDIAKIKATIDPPLFI